LAAEGLEILLPIMAVCASILGPEAGYADPRLFVILLSTFTATKRILKLTYYKNEEA
jgi:hypothetical protein